MDRMTSRAVKEEKLDLSSATFTELPRGREPDFDGRWENYHPNEHAIREEALRFYKQGNYENAKNEFLKLQGYERFRVDTYTGLLRTYRKIINSHVLNKQYRDAYNVFNEALGSCEGYMTERDQITYNNVLVKLRETNPEEYFRSLLTVDAIDIEIVNHKHEAAQMIETRKKADAKKWNIKDIGIHDESLPLNPNNFFWRLITKTESTSVCYQNRYRVKRGEFGVSRVVFADKEGNIKHDFIIQFGVASFYAIESKILFLILSNDLILYSFSENGCMGTCDLKNLIGGLPPSDKFSPDDLYFYKYQVRCLDASPEGQYFLITYREKIYLMDPNLNLLRAWSFSTQEVVLSENMQPDDFSEPVAGSVNHETATLEFPHNYNEELNVLGLSRIASVEDIKNAFRSKIFGCHPDRNPDNPNEAKEETIQVIAAFERLMEVAGSLKPTEPKIEAKKTVKKEYHHDTYPDLESMTEHEIIEAFRESWGTEHEEDWNEASFVTHNANKIYLGRCSGKLYRLDKDGHVEKVYNCHNIIRAIREVGEYLLVKTDYWLYILKNEQYFLHINMEEQGNISFFSFFNKGFMIRSRNALRIFTNDGSQIATISSKNRICDAYFEKGTLWVKTERKAYVLSILTKDEN